MPASNWGIVVKTIRRFGDRTPRRHKPLVSRASEAARIVLSVWRGGSNNGKGREPWAVAIEISAREMRAAIGHIRQQDVAQGFTKSIKSPSGSATGVV
ncbi:Hypothetical protein, putative [Bodo saltans]|uniref:Uncharacterized protein n=1 Tax=Bodo saltans TaxID=75058 RepID=A0A0S4IV91_BODSA|nr:Hypothetical protein, putative [Bodo saltans]|eukprot:CUF98918.1 Hypothetical protein, putative [Bodo saltans]